MLAKTGKDVDVQATVQEPQLYILGQSKSTVEDQMKFIPSRQEDLRDLKNPTETDSGTEVWDIVRFKNGDIPAMVMEEGTQHGGDYGCPGNTNSSYDVKDSLQKKYKTLECKRNLVLSGSAGTKVRLHRFIYMKVDELKAELRGRGRSGEGKKKKLEKELSGILGGTTRIPALLHPRPQAPRSNSSLTTPW